MPARNTPAFGRWIRAHKANTARRLKHGKPVAPAPETRRKVRENIEKRAREQREREGRTPTKLLPLD